ncbi:hypothetical protein FDK15_12905 [Geobacillus thermoleovorans]|nr:hypothetical protein FDK15_12905 [Geobacillus thermoleovorans]
MHQNNRKKQRRWSSLYARPIDVGGIVVCRPPFHCLAAIRTKMSYMRLGITKEEMSHGHDAI